MGHTHPLTLLKQAHAAANTVIVLKRGGKRQREREGSMENWGMKSRDVSGYPEEHGSNQPPGVSPAGTPLLQKQTPWGTNSPAESGYLSGLCAPQFTQIALRGKHTCCPNTDTQNV